ncbi:hypothetical protein ACVBIO_20940 [Shewanella sp. 0m-8]
MKTVSLCSILLLALLTGCSEDSTNQVNEPQPELAPDTLIQASNISVATAVTTMQSFDLDFNLASNQDHAKVNVILVLMAGNAAASDEQYLLDTVTLEALTRFTPVSASGLAVPSDVLSGQYQLMAKFETVPDDVQGEIVAIAEPISLGQIDVIQADKPNLKITMAELENASFVLAERPDDNQGFNQGDGDIYVNFMMTAEFLDVSEPVELQATIDLPGLGVFPLNLTSAVSGREPTEEDAIVHPETNQVYDYVKSDTRTLAVTCEEERCASIGVDDQEGLLLDLRINEQVYDLLAAHQQDLVGEVTISLDPNGAISEWQGMVDDNSIRLPVIFLATTPPDSDDEQPIVEDAKQGIASYASAVARAKTSTIFEKAYQKSVGSSGKAKIEYKVQGSAKYTSGTAGVPKNIDTRLYGWVKAWVFGKGLTLLNVDSTALMENADKSNLKYKVQVAGKTVWSITRWVPDDYKGMQVIYNSHDGDEETLRKEVAKVCKGKTIKKWSVKFGSEACIKGEVGLMSRNYFHTSTNTIKGRTGPYAKLKATADASIGGSFASAGIGSNLDLIYLSPQLGYSGVFDNGNQVSSTVSLDMVREHLDGYIKIWAKINLLVGKVKKSHKIMSWKGPKYSDNLWRKYKMWGHSQEIDVPRTSYLKSTYRLYVSKSQRKRSDDKMVLKAKGQLNGDHIDVLASCPITSGTELKHLATNYNMKRKNYYGLKKGFAGIEYYLFLQKVGKTLSSSEIKKYGLTGKKYWVKYSLRNKFDRTHTLPHKDCNLYAHVNYKGGKTGGKNVTLRVE